MNKQKALLNDEEIKKASQITSEEPYWWLNILRRNAQAQLDKCWDIAKKEGKGELFDAIMEMINRGDDWEKIKSELEANNE